MRPIKKLVAVTGTYTDRNGQEKKQYTTCGKLFQREDGSLVVKMDAVPVNFNGWLSCYDLEEKRKDNYQQGMQQAKQAAINDMDSNIPF